LLYLTWCLRDGNRVVHLIADEASLDAVKKEQQDRIAREVAKEGIAGQIEASEGKAVRFMAYPTYWAQAGKLKPGQEGRLGQTGKGFRRAGATVSAKLVSQKNRGSYGSGVNDIVLELAKPDDARILAKWTGAVVRLIPGK